MKAFLGTRVARVLLLGSLWLLAGAPASAQNALSPGNLVVLRVGDGASALANTGGVISLNEYTTGGSLVQSLGVTSTGATGLQVSGTATSEGLLNISPDGTTLSFAGYNPGAGGFTGTGSLASRTSVQAPRAYGTVSVSTGTYTFGSTFSGTGTDFTGNNIRSAMLLPGGGAYGSGGNQGLLYNPGTGAGTVISSNVTNQRGNAIINGDLYFSTGSGTQGIYKITGTPTSGPNTAAPFLTGVVGQGTNPYGFVMSPGALANGSTLYVGDATLGVQKFTYNGTAWAFNYNITATGNGITDVTVDFSGANPVIYAVNPASLLTYTDTGSGGAFTSLASAGTNYAFRGVELVPTAVPEPGTVLGLGVAGLGIVGWVRRRRSKNVDERA